MESHLIKSHPIRPVNNPLIAPYISTVLIQSDSPIGIFNGSGVIIGKRSVLTVAHIMYDKKKMAQTTFTSVFVQTKNGLQKVKVTKINIPQQYKNACIEDMNKYDFAHLQLEQSSIITEEHILSLKWNWFETEELFQVLGFSSPLDQKYNTKQRTMYHLRCQKTIKMSENQIVYDNKADRGISGGPIIINEKGVFKVIGLHQGFQMQFSRGVLLTNTGKNPSQTLRGIQIPQALLNQQLNIQKTSKQYQTLKEQIKRLTEQNQFSIFYFQKNIHKYLFQPANLPQSQDKNNQSIIQMLKKDGVNLQDYIKTPLLLKQCPSCQIKYNQQKKPILRQCGHFVCSYNRQCKDRQCMVSKCSTKSSVRIQRYWPYKQSAKYSFVISSEDNNIQALDNVNGEITFQMLINQATIAKQFLKTPQLFGFIVGSKCQLYQDIRCKSIKSQEKILNLKSSDGKLRNKIMIIDKKISGNYINQNQKQMLWC